MPTPLDDLIARLRHAPPNRDLSVVDAKVWRRIDRLRRTRVIEAWLTPSRIGGAALALALGAALGAAQARDRRQADDLAGFQMDGRFTLTTLVDGRR